MGKARILGDNDLGCHPSEGAMDNRRRSNDIDSVRVVSNLRQAEFSKARVELVVDQDVALCAKQSML